MMPPVAEQPESECPKEQTVPIERVADHPTFDLGGNTITSLAAPARGSDETALFRIDLPPGGALPAHHHDHFDVFTVTAGSATVHIAGETSEVAAGDAVVVPPEAVHRLTAGADGASIVVTMVARTKLIRADDGSVTVPPWVG
jgi:quercetin dioxygenase-like cupin family protein